MHASMMIDEITEDKLKGELNYRILCRERGVCDYCYRSPDTKPCKFPDRHRDERIKPSTYTNFRLAKTGRLQCITCGDELGYCGGRHNDSAS